MERERVVLDGGSFIGADLSGKILVYKGGKMPNLAGATLKGVGIELEDAAADTILTIAYLESLFPDFFGQVVEKAREDIKKRTKRIPTH
jgi:hypothetical protein